MPNISDVADEVARRLEKLGFEIFDSDDVLEALESVVFVSVTPQKYDGEVATADQVLNSPAIHESDKGIYFIQTRLTHPVQNTDGDLVDDEADDEEDEDAECENEREVT
jgi:hypothetical protein